MSHNHKTMWSQPMCNSCKCYSPWLLECKPPISICPRIKQKAPPLCEVVCPTTISNVEFFLWLSNVELCMQPMCNSCKCYSPWLFECKPPICPRIKEKAPLLSEVVCVTQPYALLKCSPACKLCVTHASVAPHMAELIHPLGHTIIISLPFKPDHGEKV